MLSPTTEPDHRRQLRDSVAEFARRCAQPKAIRTDIASSAGFSLERWKDMAALGWTSLLLPEAHDGLEMQHADLAALHTEIGHTCLPEPLAIVPLLVAQTLSLGDNAELAAQHLPVLASGEVISTLAWQGSLGAMGAADVAPEARQTGDGWLISGEAQFVPCASFATTMIVAACVQGGVALFWLDDAPIIRQETRHADGTPLASVRFDRIEVPQTACISGPGKGAFVLEHVLDSARLATSAELLGIMEGALEMTLGHLRQREQFGKPIGSFQALQHRAVDLYIQIELARSSVARAADAFDANEDTPTRAAHVSAAKSRCGDGALKVIKECIQMHGAIGYTAEYDLSLYVNRALHLSAWLGNPRAHRARWAALAKEARDGD